jgi:hypothetical protein
MDRLPQAVKDQKLPNDIPHMLLLDIHPYISKASYPFLKVVTH